MAAVTNITGLSNDNQIQGTFPDMKDSEIIFRGKNNILYCEPNVNLIGSKLQFKADDSVIYLSSSEFPYKVNVAVGNDVVFHIGKNNYINTTIRILLAEQRHCFIGDHCLFAPDIIIRNADPHLIYDCATKKRINPTRSVYIGDHVWVGQEVFILKGTQVDSGSIIGARSVAAGSKIGHNTVWVGSPARQVKEGVFWNLNSVNEWAEDMTKASQNYSDLVGLHLDDHQFGDGIFSYNESEALGYDQIDQQLNERKTSQEKCDYLIQLNNTKTKNRFVHSS